jgi:predicted DNA-binding protein (MmcQ/YjbR family)
MKNTAPTLRSTGRRKSISMVVRGYHCPPIQQPYFNTISLDGSVPDDVLAEMIEHSYKVVVGKLPKKYQRELEESGQEV